MAATQVKCPSCKTLLQLAALPPAGSGIKCPKCGQVFRVAGSAPPSPTPAKAAPPPQPPKASPVTPARPAPVAPAAAAKTNEKVAPRPTAVPKAVAKPVAVPAKKAPQDDGDDLPPPKRRAANVDDDLPPPKRRSAEDDDAFTFERGRKRSARDDDDDEDDRPVRRSRTPRKSNQKLLIVVIAVLLVAGVAIGGTVWVVKSLFGGKSDDVAESSAKEGDPPPDNGLDVRFVGEDFLAGFVVNVPSILKAPVVSSSISAMPPGFMNALADQLGFDVRKVERLTILVDYLPGDASPPPALIVRFVKPTDGKAVLTKAFQEVQESSMNGKTFLVSTGMRPGGFDAGIVADQQTIVIGPNPTLHKMLDAKGNGPLAARMKRLDLSADVSGAFVLTDPWRQVIKESLKEGGAAPDLPPEFAELPTLPDRLRAGSLTLNLKGESLLELTLEGTNDESGEVVEKLLRSGVKTFQQVVPGLQAQLAGALPPGQAKPLRDALKQLPDGIAVTRDGSRVRAVVKSPKNLDKLGPVLGSILLTPKRQPDIPDRPDKPFRPGGPAETDEGKLYTNREQGFSVQFPGEPQQTTNKEPGGDATVFQVKRDNGLVIYKITCREGSVDLSDQVAIVFDQIAAGFADKIKSRKDIQLKGYRGQEMVIELTNAGAQIVITARYYVVQKRMYQVEVIAARSKHNPVQVKKFLDSFALLGEPSPANLPIAALPPKPLPQPTASGDSLKGDTKAVGGLLPVTPIKLPAGTAVRCLTWADDKGSAFYALDGRGELRRVSYPDLKEVWKLNLGERCLWAALSSEGLLVTPATENEVWLIDPESGEMKARFPVPNVKRAAATRSSAIGIAATGRELYVLDLKRKTATKFVAAGSPLIGYEDPVLTPDGKYLLTGGWGRIHRFSLAGGKLRYEESSEGVVQGREDSGITVSPDSQRVCYPSYVGGGTGKNYTLAVFKTDDLKKRELVLDPGGTAVGFDPTDGYVFTNNLRLYDNKGGLIKEYGLGGLFMRQILPHPNGGTVLVLTSDALTTVALPKK